MENRTTNAKNSTQNKSTSQTAQNAANEHKHPNQYTKGADDEGSKNCRTNKNS